MPRDKDFKRHVRARMEKTGEAYTTARAQLLGQAKTRNTAPADVSPRATSATPATPAPPVAPATADAGVAGTAGALPPEPPDYPGVAGMADATIEAKTGRTWAGWVGTLDALGADRMEHRDIARIVNEQYDVDGWWAQTVTVGYERIKGLRDRGQRRGGSYEASKSKTFAVPVTTLFDACADEATRRRWLTGAQPRMSTASRPRSMRLRWDDGTLVAFWFMEKGAAKSALSVQHTKLPDRAASERLKEYWSERLAALAELLSNT